MSTADHKKQSSQPKTCLYVLQYQSSFRADLPTKGVKINDSAVRKNMIQKRWKVKNEQEKYETKQIIKN
jgi:hypothetical protein